jgi:hypothetical protein
MIQGLHRARLVSSAIGDLKDETSVEEKSLGLIGVGVIYKESARRPANFT